MAVAPPDKRGWTPDSFLAYLTSSAPLFVTDVLAQLHALPVKFDDAWQIDHICYRCDTENEYSHLTKTVLPHLGHLLVESVVGSRFVASFKLSTPIVLPHRPNATVDVLEVPSPKPGSHYDSGLEHIEVVVPYSLDAFLAENPSHSSWDLKGMTKTVNRDARVPLGSVSVKFHEQSLERVIELEVAGVRTT
ncbi:hypothetical protein DYB32_004376 [Aphanomyces invadans]|uniref:Uncharacterized protein n=1 Tax=Aphanomyces invadans TaxID=157072 RepID=A0A3R6VY40_9STRA|nr:hypothetical protein DYB32_004376 [Aphanomyces invadans]